jgi:hypothetical protein
MQKMNFSRTLYLLLFLFPFVSKAQHKIEGTLPDPAGKWGRIHLEYIPSIENLSSLMSKNVVGGSPIDSAGKFSIDGIGLPPGKHLYRLFLMPKTAKEGNYGISNGLVRNFNMVVLDSNSHLTVQCGNVSESFSFCDFVNNPESRAIAQLYDQITVPLLGELAKDTVARTSELKMQMLSKRKSDLLKNFADTANYVIPGIVALQLLPDFEAAFKESPQFFRDYAP